MTHLSIAMAEAIVLGAVLGSLADWLFAGVLFHARYQSYPEVWRTGVGETGRIILAQAFAVLTSAAFVLFAVLVGRTDPWGAAMLAAMIWLVGPLPLLITNHLFIKLDPLVTASHAAGWLVKLLLVAGATTVFLR
jgi:intracellular septation protein A